MNIYFPAVLVINRVSCRKQDSTEPSLLHFAGLIASKIAQLCLKRQEHWALPAIQSETLTRASVKNSVIHIAYFLTQWPSCLTWSISCTFREAQVSHRASKPPPANLEGKTATKKTRDVPFGPPFGKSVELQCLSYNSCHWLLIWSSLLKRKHFMALSFQQARTLRCNTCDLSESCTPVRLQCLQTQLRLIDVDTCIEQSACALW